MVFGAAPDVDISGEGPQGEIHFGVGVQAVFTSFKQAYKTPKKKFWNYVRGSVSFTCIIYFNARDKKFMYTYKVW